MGDLEGSAVVSESDRSVEAIAFDALAEELQNVKYFKDRP